MANSRVEMVDDPKTGSKRFDLSLEELEELLPQLELEHAQVDALATPYRLRKQEVPEYIHDAINCVLGPLVVARRQIANLRAAQQ